MKIQLPNGERITLPSDLSIEEKMELSLKLTEEWKEAIHRNWHSETIIFFLDGLSNYINWHKDEEDKYSQDEFVLSIKRVEQMSGKRKAMSIPFSSLPTLKRELLGLE